MKKLIEQSKKYNKLIKMYEVELNKLKKVSNRFDSSLYSVNKLDKNFISWFSGLIDGDGWFKVNKKQGSCIFILEQNVCNYNLLLYIQNHIGGEIKLKYKNIDVIRARLIFRNGIEVWRILEVLSYDNLKTSRLEEFKFVREWYSSIKRYKSKNVSNSWNLKPSRFDYSYKNINPRINLWWLRGFIEADGCFYIGSSGKWLSPGFGITKKLDKEILYFIKKLLLEKCISCEIYNWNNSFTLHIRDKKNIIKFINYLSDELEKDSNNLLKEFSSGLIGIKGLEFEIWKDLQNYINDSCLSFKEKKNHLLLCKKYIHCVRKINISEKNGILKYEIDDSEIKEFLSLNSEE